MCNFITLKNEPKEQFPGANCQWCGDTGEFEDTEGKVWPCWDDCPRPKAPETTEPTQAV